MIPSITPLIRVLGLSLYGPQAASHRVRLSQFQPGLAHNRIHLEIHSLLDDFYLKRTFSGENPSIISLFAAYLRRLRVLLSTDQYDLVIVYGELLPLVPGWLERRLIRVPFIYDCDDAFHLKYRQGRLRWLQPFFGAKIDRMMAAASAITVGNAELATHARQFNTNVTLLPSVVDSDHYQPAHLQLASPSQQPFTVGWIGSPSTAPFLEDLVNPLEQLALERPVRLVVVGGPGPSASGFEVIEYPWALDQEVPLIQQFDVGVMPLPNTLWTRCKSAYKLVQCMACGIPVIASPVGANLDVVLPTCGFLADGSHQWLQAFRLLAGDPALLKQMGHAARVRIIESYSLRSVLPILERVIRDAVA